MSTSLGTDDFAKLMTSAAFASERALIKIFLGLCSASCRTVSLPSPAFPVEVYSIRSGTDALWKLCINVPPVTNIIFPVKSGTSISGLKLTEPK